MKFNLKRIRQFFSCLIDNKQETKNLLRGKTCNNCASMFYGDIKNHRWCEEKYKAPKNSTCRYWNRTIY